MSDEDREQPFYGTVILRNWARMPDGAQYIGMTGSISIIQDKSAFGFRMTGADRNWMAQIKGSTMTYFAPGCEVMGVVQHEMDIDRINREYYLLD